jgi:hypothetical protein
MSGSALNLSRLAKILTTIGHPRTHNAEVRNALRALFKMANFQDSDGSAVQALRAIYTLLGSAGISFDDMVDPKTQIHINQAPNASSLIRDRNEAVQQTKDLKRKLAAAEVKIQKLESKLDVANDKLREALRESRDQSKARKSKVQATRVSHDDTEPTAANLEGLVAALAMLRKIDPDMRIKTAISLILTHTADQKGVTIKGLAAQVDNASEASIRYALRSLSHGWPGKRAGHGLVKECASPDGGRARVYVTTPKGCAVLSYVAAALRSTRGARPVLMLADIRLAA